MRNYARTASVRVQTSDWLRMCRALFWWCRCVRVESCCCGFSLEQGSLAISVVSFLFGIVGIVAFGITFNSGPNYIPLGYGIVQIVSRLVGIVCPTVIQISYYKFEMALCVS